MLYGFFITFTSYGTWLHGNERGSWNRKADALQDWFIPVDPALEEIMRKRMTHPPMTLTGPMRKCVREAIAQHCKFKGWKMHAINVRTNHVHVVVTAPDDTAARVLNAMKARATLMLRQNKLVDADRPIWTERGSKIPLDNEQGFYGAIHYVKHGQGPDLPDE
jgi:REP element-mobilizing transposase RayT